MGRLVIIFTLCLAQTPDIDIFFALWKFQQITFQIALQDTLDQFMLIRLIFFWKQEHHNEKYIPIQL